MLTPISSLAQILATLEPTLHSGCFAYCSVAHDTPLLQTKLIGTFREAEGLTVIVEESVAKAQEWEVLFRAAWITLKVHSDLAAVGLTAAFSACLAQHGISCNAVAGAYHDHLFVPFDRADEAISALRQLQEQAQT